MRAEYIDKVKLLGKEGFWQSPVIDVGGAGVGYQRNQSYDMREIFSRWDIPYFCLDIENAPGIDFVENAEDMAQQQSNYYGTVLCLGMLEHVDNPFKVIDECFRILKPGGVIFVSVPFEYPVHSPKDYWRFTDQGLEYLVRMFEKIELQGLGGYATRNHEIYYIGRKPLGKDDTKTAE